MEQRSGAELPDHHLSNLQQQALDCSACFAVHGRQVTTNDIAECRSANLMSLRSALNVLEESGLVVNNNPGKRPKLYQPTPTGLRSVSKGFEPWDCPTAAQQKEQPLPPAVEKVLDCASCLSEKGAVIGKSAISLCQGMNSGTAAYGLVTLAKRGYAEEVKGKGRQENTYQLTAKGLAAAQQPKCDTPKEKFTPRQDPLTENQQKVLACISCQLEQKLTPDRRRVMDCTELDSQAARKAAAALVTRGILRFGKQINPGIRTATVIQTYKPARKEAIEPKRAPNCIVDLEENDNIFERMSPARQQLLGCLACIATKISEGQIQLPGASQPLLRRCTDQSEGLVQKLTETLVRDNYYTRLEGYQVDGIRQVYLQPTPKGEKLLEYYRESQTEVRECLVDFNAVKIPTHTRNAIIKCLGCIWTQQIASQHIPAAPAQLISKCSGIDYSHIIANVIPGLEREGYLRINPKRMQRSPATYSPTTEMKTLFGHNADCRVDSLSEDELIAIEASLHDSFFTAGEGDTAYKDFEDFINGLLNPSSDTYVDALSPEAPRHRILSAGEESFYGVVIQKSAREALVEKAVIAFTSNNMRLARWMSYKLGFGRMLPREEVAQAAAIGVYKAVQKFNPLMGFKFSTYAYVSMKSSIRRTIADYYGVAPSHVDAMPSLFKARQEFKDKNGRDPTVEELAQLCGKSKKRTAAILETIERINTPRSLDATNDDNFDLHKVVADKNAESSGTLGLFSKLAKHLNVLEKHILQIVIIDQQATIGEVAEASERPGEIYEAFERLMSLLRHPHFGLGSALGGQNLLWHDEAACATGDFDQIASFCSTCPVNLECRDYAKTAKPKIRSGVWGGREIKKA